MIERTYNVPLRKGFINKAKHKKTKKAVSTLKEFLQKHMKSDKIKIGKNLNKFLWQHGIKNPPHHVKVHVIKEDDGTVKAELVGFKYAHLNKEQREKVKESKPEKKNSAPKDLAKADAQEVEKNTSADDTTAKEKESAPTAKTTKPKKKEPPKK